MVDVAALRARVLAVNLATHGVPVTVRRAQQPAIQTVGIWMASLIDESAPVGGDLHKRRTRRVLSLPSSDAAVAVFVAAGRANAAAVPDCGRGTKIDAPPVVGGASRTWIVDEVDAEDADHLRVILKLAP